jgi:hypothetical protein
MVWCTPVLGLEGRLAVQNGPAQLLARRQNLAKDAIDH